MSKLKTKIFSLLVLVGLLSILAVVGWQTIKPETAPETTNFPLAQHGNNSPSSPSPSTPEPSPPQTSVGNEPTEITSTILAFASDLAKQQFLAANGLAESNLSPTTAGAYVVDKSPGDLSLPEGTNSYPNRIYLALLTPNDPNYSQQWHLPKISAPAAWDTTTGASSTTIAVIDTGFSLDHQDLSSKWSTNGGEVGSTVGEGPAPNCTSLGIGIDKQCNNLDDDGNGKTDDWRGWDFACENNSPATVDGDCDNNPTGNGVSHGTLTAGVTAAASNNGVGVAGVNWQAKILPLQALRDSGSGTTTDVAEAIDYAVSRGAKVISLSLGSTGVDNFLRQRIDAAISAGVTIVAAAGNCGDPSTYIFNGCDFVGQMLEPANYPPVIGVGASDQNDNRSSFSSYGATLDVMAPGSGIVTTAWTSGSPTTAYGSASGTSLSTPIVSGVVGLTMAMLADLTPSEITYILMTGLDKPSGMGGANHTHFYGFGRINSRKAVNLSTLIHPDGIVVLTQNGLGVYLMEGGQRHSIPSGVVFSSQGFDWNRVKSPTAPDNRLSNISNVNFREGTLIEAQGAVYVIDTVGGVTQKRGIASWQAFVDLGYSVSELVHVTPADLPSQDGAIISNGNQHPDGTLIFAPDGSGVHIIEGGQRRGIVSGPVFESYGYNWGKIKNPTGGDNGLALGSNLANHREGTLLEAQGSIYIVDVTGDGTVQKRGIGSWETFIGLGFKLSEVNKVSSSELPSQTGTTIVF